jgi:hypothetical protein
MLTIEKRGDDLFVEGVVMRPRTAAEPDLQGDFYDSEVVRQSAYEFMLQSRQLGVMHKSMLSAEHAGIVESRLTKRQETVGDETVPAGSWILKIKVLSSELRKRVLNGTFNGFSIGGSGRYEE